LPRLVAVIHPEHIASRRVAEKIGMHVEKRVTVEEDYAALIYVSESVAPARGAR
jgi:RimJ/RimL family protein N-acetyltransferase